jgi:hypothetical protein
VDRPGADPEGIVFGFDRDGRADFLQMSVWTLVKQR